MIPLLRFSMSVFTGRCLTVNSNIPDQHILKDYITSCCKHNYTSFLLPFPSQSPLTLPPYRSAKNYKNKFNRQTCIFPISTDLSTQTYLHSYIHADVHAPMHPWLSTHVHANIYCTYVDLQCLWGKKYLKVTLSYSMYYFVIYFRLNIIFYILITNSLIHYQHISY